MNRPSAASGDLASPAVPSVDGLALQSGCITGAPSKAEYQAGLTAAGFADVSVTFPTDPGPSRPNTSVWFGLEGLGGIPMPRERAEPA
jgi:hypothetical protein